MTSLVEMLEQLTPDQRELFEMLLQEKRAQPRAAGRSIPRREDPATFPLSFGQERLWFIHQWEPESPAYNLPQAVRLHGRLDIAALERSLNEIVRRHEILRSRFETLDGQPVQIIEPTLILSIPVEQIPEGPPDERAAMVQRRLVEEARRPFDLERGALLRTRLFQLGRDEHVMLLTMHHIVSDGWSNGVLVRELGALYRAFAAGQAAPLAEPPIQYADYAAWQRQLLQGERLESQLAYWRERLTGAPPVIELPTDRPRPPAQRYHGAQHPLHLPAPLTEALRALGQGTGASLFMTLLAAFEVLLYRYSGQTDIVIGTPIANRTRTEIEGLIGFFVNTLVLRADLSGGPTFRALLEQVRQISLEMQEHQDLPFERLVEGMHLERNTSYAPLFQVCLALQNAPLPALTAPGLTLTPLEIDDGTAQFDLYLELYEAADGLRGRLKYNTDLFEPPTIARMARHLQTLLEGIAANPDESIERLPLLASDERRLLVEWNQTATDYPRAMTIAQLFEAQVAQAPEATALIFGDRLVSYRELNERANRLAHYLRRLGVGPEVLVGICVERSVEMIVGILGILKAGGAYLPLDPEYPQERLTFMLEDSRASVLITQKEIRDWRLEISRPDQSLISNLQSPTIIFLDTDWPTIAHQPTSNPEHTAHPDNLAYVIYTSGSTGRPKGVSVPQRAVVRLVKHTNYAELNSREICLQFAPISFDASTLEIWGSLLNGARLVIFPPHSPSLEELGQVLEQHGITTLWLTAGLFHQMAQFQLPALCGVRQILAGGDVLAVPQVRQVLQALPPGGRLINGYGPTENTTFSCCYAMDDLSQVGSTVSIGRPIANTTAYVLDAQMQPVPIGVVGELYLGGDGLATGYLNRPDLTAERFVPNPFADQRLEIRDWRLSDAETPISNFQSLISKGGRLYRTGDMVRYRADGLLEFLGRRDRQVKLRGFRIELGEVEAAITSYAGVRDAVVVTREELPGDVRLVAYITEEPRTRNQEPASEEPRTRNQEPTNEEPRTKNQEPTNEEPRTKNQEPTEEDSGSRFSVLGSGEGEGSRFSVLGSGVGGLRAFLKQHLPEYMIPSAFVTLTALPLTANGKVDRNALPAPSAHRPELSAPFVLARTPAEMELSLIWAEVLALDSIGVEDNFFELGGHSLLATRVMSRVCKTFEIELPLRTLFDHPTVARLAPQVEQARAGRNGSPPPPLSAVARDQRFPLSFAQEQLWLTDQLAPGNVAYVIPAMARVRGPLDIGVLQRCFDALIQRHEIFRTTYNYDRDEPVQIIHPAEPFPLCVEDVRGAPDPEEAAKRLAREAARTPIDLSTGPLARGMLYRMGDQEYAILMLMHHIIVDRWSSPILMGELRELYESFISDRPPALAELPVQYADFAHWQRSWLRGPAIEAQLDYWRKQLDGAPTFVDLPTDRPRPPVQTFNGAYLMKPLPAQLFERIQGLSRESHATLFMTFLAAFCTLLHRYSGQGDLVLGTPITNRSRVEVEGLIGYFLNTLLLRINLADNPSFRELLARVRDTCLSAYANQDLQFERLVQELQPRRDVSRNALYNIMFVFSPNYPMADVTSSDLTVSHMFLSGEVARRDMTMYIFVSAGGEAALQLNYNIDLFEHDTITRMLDHFIMLLHEIVANPDQRLTGLPMLRPAEIRQMVYDWNATRVPYCQEQCIHDLFMAQAARTPQAIAGIFGDRTLTYAELDRQSNRIAALLREIGVRPGSYVGVYMRRSLEMLPALLGILKAGGAYVPMEISFPPARVEWILRSLDVRCLITQSDHLPVVKELQPQLPVLRHLLCLDAAPVAPGAAPAGLGAEVQIWSGADLDSRSPQPPAALTTPNDIAYVIFTSGSTGTPKGVVVQHRPVINLIEWVTKSFGVGPHDRVLFVTSLCFDLSVYDVFGLLAAGGSIRIAAEHELRDPELLLRILGTEPITFWDSAPATLQQLAPLFDTLDPAANPQTLRLAFLSGDWIPVTLPDRLRAHFPQVQVISLGGATEATVWSNYYPIGAVNPSWASIPYGRPIQNARYYILDAALNPCPVGVPGDLYIGDECLALCYANDPVLTATKFIPNPFADQRLEIRDWRLSDTESPISNLQSLISMGTRLYKTGDRARFWPDGIMEFLGRVDFQVKIRGFRIELGEIEAVLAQHPSVQTAVATVREDRPGDKRLVAYIIPAEEPRTENQEPNGEEPRTKNQEPPAEDSGSQFSVLGSGEGSGEGSGVGSGELRAFLKQRLPEYMLPSAFVTLAALPLTPNGKLDRRALPPPDQEQDIATAPYAAPRTPREAILATVWAQVLGLARVGINDNFFEIGGDSLLALQLVARSRQAGVDISAQQLFTHQTVAELAEVVDTAPPLQSEQGVITGPLPLTEEQARLLSMGRAEVERVYWSVTRLFNVPPNLNVAALEQATAGLLRHHDALRTRFIETDAGWHSFIAAPDDRVPFVAADLSAVPDDELRAAIEREYWAVLARINLTEGPLLLVAYMDCGPARPGRLQVVVHHLVTDGVSTWLVLNDLLLGYQQLLQGQALQLPPKTTPLPVWTAHLHEYARSPALRATFEAWQRLPWNTIPPLPCDYPAPREAVTIGSQKIVTVELSADETQQLLRQLPVYYQAQMLDALLAALLYALQQWSPARWFGLLVIEGGRENIPGAPDLDVSRTVGWFSYGRYVTLERPEDPAPAAVLRDTTAQLRRNPGLRYAPLHYLSNDPALVKRLEGLKEHEISFNYAGQVTSASASQALGMATEKFRSPSSQDDRAISILEVLPAVLDGRLQTRCVYSDRLHDRATIERLMEHYMDLLRALAADIQVRQGEV